MKVPYKSLKKIVEKAELGFGEELKYRGISFLLFVDEDTELTRNDPNYKPAFYTYSDVVDWDIYIDAYNVPVEFRRIVLFHEILDIVLFERLMGHGNDDLAHGQAHIMARKYDDKYAKETLDQVAYRRYCDFRSKMLNGER